MNEKTDLYKTIALVVSLVVIVAMFVLMMNARQGAGSLSVKLGDSEVSIDLAGEEVNFHELVDELLGDPKNAKKTLSILRELQGLYRIDDEALVDRIRKEPGDSSLAEGLRELLADLRGPFDRQYHHHYDVRRLEIVNAINRLGYDHLVARELREMSEKTAGIFDPKGIEVIVEIAPAETQLVGSAAICQRSRYLDRDLVLVDMGDQSRAITVSAKTPLICVRGNESTNSRRLIVKIKPADASRLFGPALGDRRKPALMYPLQCGSSAAPRLVGISSSDVF